MSNRFIFFGTPDIAAIALQTLIDLGYSPELVITAPDKERGRGLQLTPTPVKKVALEHHLAIETPDRLTKEYREYLMEKGPWDFFVVAAYGKILHAELLAIPQYGTLNIHPSLLPKYRGPAPLEYVLLSNDTETGVTIMLLDELVDHGPIVLQKAFPLPPEETITTLSEKSAHLGAALLAEAMEGLKSGALVPQEQHHEFVTFTKKIQKEDGLVTLTEDPWELWKKYRAFKERPGIYFYTQKGAISIRVKIKTAIWQDGVFIIETVIPENGKIIEYREFQKQFPNVETL